MGRKKAVKAKGGWRSPIEGWEGASDTRASRGRVLQLRMDGVVGTLGVHGNAAPAFACLRDLLGDHEVRVLAQDVYGAAWESDIPWRQTRDGFRLTMNITDLAKPEVWEMIVSHTRDEPLLYAWRGRGEKRVEVWHLEFMGGERARASAELHVATRFLHHDDSAVVQRLIESFFDIGGPGVEMVRGSGELADFSTELQSPPTTAGWSFESWSRESQRYESLDADPNLLLGPSWITLLTHRQLKRMGGIEGVMQSATAFDRVMSIGRINPGWPNAADQLLGLHPVRHGIVVSVAPVHAVLHKECCNSQFGWMNDDAWANTRWLTHELHRAGLLAVPPDGWLKALDRQRRAMVADYEARVAAQRDTRRRTRRSKADAPVMHAPRCIQGVGTLEATPEHVDRGGTIGTFRIYRADLSGDEGQAIYGRRANEPNRLANPILVGALKPERASLFFDARIHGWDGEFAKQGPAKSRPIGRLTQLVCPECQGRQFHAWASFERNEEPVDMAELGEGRTPDDLFTWFSLKTTCAGCGWSATVADIECA